MTARRTKTTPRSPDVIVIGGGVMGTACAWQLARRGASVVVLERSVPGAEASTAAAGIIGAHAEASEPGPMTRLMLASLRRHTVWSEELRDATRIDVGLRLDGILRIGTERGSRRALTKKTRWMAAARMAVEPVDARAARALEPELGPCDGGVLFPKDGRIDPPAFFRAVHVAARRAGVSFRTGTYVRAVDVRGDRARGVVLEDGRSIEAGAVLVAAGSWTKLIAGDGLDDVPVIPARGQIVELTTPAPCLGRIVMGPRCYVVPRDDGRALVGSTLEFVGYRREVTARAVRDLLDAAIEMVPALADATLSGSWCNFRPYTQDTLPFLGPARVPGLFVATGHYRTGILLAPITAEALAAAVSGDKPPVALRPFAPGRGEHSGRPAGH
jgi:glycine oxidase